jgi:hypothetical protein
MRSLAVQSDGRIIVTGEVLGQAFAPSGQTAVFRFLGGDSARIRPLGERRAVEYFHAGQGHYFLTAETAEIASLDVFNPDGWARTGATFQVWDDDASSLSTVCRFWSGASFAPKSSHFYTPDAEECASLKAGNTWLFEGNVFDLRHGRVARLPDRFTASLSRLQQRCGWRAESSLYDNARNTR